MKSTAPPNETGRAWMLETEAGRWSIKQLNSWYGVDNLVEHACATLVDRLLRECPGLHILATSREPIGILGEATWSLATLASPDTDATSSVAEIRRSPAVCLFVDHAAAADPSFELAGNNAHTIARICRRLDGIPLALELAAARLGALTPSELAQRLDQRFVPLAAATAGVTSAADTRCDA
jgi:predicted ATPase